MRRFDPPPVRRYPMSLFPGCMAATLRSCVATDDGYNHLGADATRGRQAPKSGLGTWAPRGSNIEGKVVLTKSLRHYGDLLMGRLILAPAVR